MIDGLEALPADVANAADPGTYGSIRTTLEHLVGAEGRYVVRLRGESPSGPPREPDGSVPLATLRAEARRSGEALIAIAEQSTGDPILTGTWRGEPYSLRTSVLLVQAINHATEDRGQIASIPGRSGIEPPGLDAWAFDEDPEARGPC